MMPSVQFAIRGTDILVRAGFTVDAPVPEAPDSSRPWSALSCDMANLPVASDAWNLPLSPGAKGGAAETALACRYEAETPAPDGWEWLPLRNAILILGENAWHPAARAMAFLNWRASTRFCGRCGAPNEDKPDEVARRCTACGSLSFPRLSPAVLAVVRKGDRLLLARNAHSTLGFWSLIAGFVEPGEPLEECVRREVAEEVRIAVMVKGYLGSQPWPFPDQLMMGFSAEWKSGELEPDGVEIAEAGWFGPDDHPPVPNVGSLSRWLIDRAFEDIRAGR